MRARGASLHSLPPPPPVAVAASRFRAFSASPVSPGEMDEYLMLHFDSRGDIDPKEHCPVKATGIYNVFFEAATNQPDFKSNQSFFP